MMSPFSLSIDGLAEPPVVVSFDGKETIHRGYVFHVVVHVAHAEPRAFEAAVFDHRAELRFSTTLAGARVVGGFVDRVEWRGVQDKDKLVFRLRLVPRLARLERRRMSRIFQDMSASEVIDEVLGGHGIPRRLSLSKRLPKRAYCVQHRETDRAFVTRLMAEEGLFHFFEDAGIANPEEVLVIGDDVSVYADIAGDPTLVFREGDTDAALHHEEHHLRSVAFRRTLASQSTLVRDHDYLRPRAPIATAAEGPKVLSRSEPGIGILEPTPKLRERSDLFYEHHGDYDDPSLDRPAARTLLEQLRSRTAQLRARSGCMRVSPGHRFVLAEHELASDSPRWVVSSVEHHGRVADLAGKGDLYENQLTAVPAATPLRPRPPRRAPAAGAETAVVVGPSGTEVHVDELGRIKVQFHWDLHGEHDERSSCWIRVAQAWAGEGFGAQFIPRVGMEVLITFLGGDPDRPVVTGCLYNAVQPPAFQLPSAQVTSGIRTRSSPGGGGHHELSFNDAAGAEVITLRSQRNLELASRRDMEVSAGGERTTRIHGDDTLDVTCDRKAEIAGHDTTLVRGERHTTVLGADTVVVGESRSVHVAGLETATYEGGAAITSERSFAVAVHDNLSLAVGCGTSSAQVNVSGSTSLGSSRAITIVSDDRITLRVGSSSIVLEPDGITLQGATIRLKGSEAVVAEGNGPRLSLADEIELTSKKISLFAEKARIELDRDASIKGDKVLLNCQSKDPGEAKDKSEKKTKPFKVQLTDPDFEPYAGKHFVAFSGGERLEGDTTADGNVEIAIPDDATVVDVTAWLDTYPTGRRRTWQIQVAKLPPANDPQGAQSRLANLGYLSGTAAPELTDVARAALRWFQKDHELEETGELDDATAAELAKVHGG